MAKHKTYSRHQLSKNFGYLRRSENARIFESLKRRGQETVIVALDDKIIDGWQVPSREWLEFKVA